MISHDVLMISFDFSYDFPMICVHAWSMANAPWAMDCGSEGRSMDHRPWCVVQGVASGTLVIWERPKQYPRPTEIFFQNVGQIWGKCI